jgi:hypothetical protein
MSDDPHGDHEERHDVRRAGQPRDERAEPA